MNTAVQARVGRPKTIALLALAIGSAIVGVACAGDNVLVVHEWGTFTSLQNEQGKELTGINTDDEPVPAFVHNLNPYLLSRPVLSSLHWRYRQKGAPRVHPQITMRLETPVIYFYPPQDWPKDKTVDVSVRFRGGWLTEFYPKADAQAPGLAEGRFNFGELTSGTTSNLAWTGLLLGEDAKGPTTDQHVWLAPRKVPASNITSVGGESERYLFYRGVGHLRAPLRATMDRKAGQLTLHANFDEVLSSRETEQIPALWLVQVRDDGQCAFRTLEGFSVSGDTAAAVAKTNFRFEPSDFQADNRERLSAAMHAAIVTDGLSADEATALLGTWQRSYFVSPGLRVFFLVPGSWTDHYLPLTVTNKSEITRVMVGRLELISDEQRANLDKLAHVSILDGTWVERIPESPARDRFLAGRTDFGELGVAIPADYQLYLDLGRFRNALVAHEERVRPAANLTKFIDEYGLHPFRIPPETKAAPQAK